MQDVTITELDSNLSFRAKIDNPPANTQNFSTVYIDEKEVRRPNVTQSNGLIEIKVADADNVISDFLIKWNSSRKRIDLMIETDDVMYFLKGCSVKRFESPKKAFLVFYNTFKQA